METIEKHIPEIDGCFICTSNPILDDNGDIKLIIKQLTDITEKKKMDENVQQAQKLEAIGTLAGGIAHDEDAAGCMDKCRKRHSSAQQWCLPEH